MPAVTPPSSPPAPTPPVIVLAHGAGAPMDSPFMDSIAAALAQRGLAVGRFEFPYMARRRRDGSRRPPDREPVLRASWRTAVEIFGGGGQVVIGGKSMGGRLATMVADELGVRGVVCLGYPFHPPGRPERLRTAHLRDLATPTLVVQGTRDPFGSRDDVDGYELAPTLAVHWIEDGDHSLAPRRRVAGRGPAEAMEEIADRVAAFVRGLG